MKRKITSAILLLSLLVLFSATAKSQESAKISPYIQLRYLKNSDDKRILQTSLTYSKNRMELPLPGMEISFYKGIGNKELIGKAVTDNKGVAAIDLASDIKLAVAGEGLWEFTSDFAGNDSIESGSSEVKIKDVILEMSLGSADSIKTVSVKAFSRGNGKDIPAAGEVVKIYVPRMFSLLPIGELTLDDTGAASVEFPNDLPGDKDSSLTIIAKFEENEKFGNVERVSTIKWGTPKADSGSTTNRALWTKTAPKWMIYTLSVLLAGVWGHYLYAIISLIRIRISAKRKEEEENYGKVKK
jgi:hypothetical protein